MSLLTCVSLDIGTSEFPKFLYRRGKELVVGYMSRWSPQTALMESDDASCINTHTVLTYMAILFLKEVFIGKTNVNEDYL